MRRVIKAGLSTLNRGEMKQFDSISEWWHPSGPMHILYKYNYQRVQFLREHVGGAMEKPLEKLRVLDVGCGAGFLTKSLARLGADVVGLDPNSTSFREATEHQAKLGGELPNLKYYNTTLEGYLQDTSIDIKQFDIVTSMDVIEHVDNPKQFLSHISKSVKSGGTVMVSTIAKNAVTWFTHILLAEYVTNIVPKNTHSYDKFINPNDLQQMMLQLGLQVVSKRELQLNWRGEFDRRAGGGNYMVIGRKGELPAK